MPRRYCKDAKLFCLTCILWAQHSVFLNIKMAFPTKGWPKHVGRNLRKRGGGHLLLMYGKAWRPQNIETSRRRRPRYRDGLAETSRDPPLTRSAMTRRQIAWIVNYPEKRSYPCYDIYCSDATRAQTPRLDPDTERILSSPYQDLGVSVTISGHRFIALSPETSWIDKCKGCGNIDAVEFITRCGAHTFCRRICVQAFVQHRRYRRQIMERPLFTRPHHMRSNERVPEEEIVLNEKPVRVKRKYTKRKNVDKDAVNKPTSGDDEKKRVKRPYKKREKQAPKLKVKMQLDKIHRDLKKSNIESICDHDHRDEAHNIANAPIPSSVSSESGAQLNHESKTMVGSYDTNCQDERGIEKTVETEKTAEKTKTTVKVEGSKDIEVKQSKSNCDNAVDARNSPYKLGNVKIVLTKCMPRPQDGMHNKLDQKIV